VRALPGAMSTLMVGARHPFGMISLPIAYATASPFYQPFLVASGNSRVDGISRLAIRHGSATARSALAFESNALADNSAVENTQQY